MGLGTASVHMVGPRNSRWGEPTAVAAAATHIEDCHIHIEDCHTHIEDCHTHIEDCHTHIEDCHTDPNIHVTYSADSLRHKMEADRILQCRTIWITCIWHWCFTYRGIVYEYWAETTDYIIWTNAFQNRCYMCIQRTRVLYSLVIPCQSYPPISQFNSHECLVNVCIQ